MTRDGSHTEHDAGAYAHATTEPEAEDIDYAPLEGGGDEIAVSLDALTRLADTWNGRRS